MHATLRATLLLSGILSATVAGGGAAHAQPQIMRMAAIAPEGTAWTRELRAFGRDVEQATEGEVRLKWYFGGIAGDEQQVADRMKRGQLDGTASGGMLCMRAAPSMRVMRVQGLFQTREEAAYVQNRLSATVDEEAHQNGYIMLGKTGMGPDVVFSRAPVKSLDDLRHLKMWRWDLDDAGILMSRELGVPIIALSPDQAARAFDDGRVDGFMGIPAAALAFQWSARAHYVSDLWMGYLTGCLLVDSRFFDKLSQTNRTALRAAAAKLNLRMEDVGRQQDDALMGGLFAKQGLKAVPASEQFRAEFLAEARASRERLGAKLVPNELLQRVLAMLADYREEHRAARTK